MILVLYVLIVLHSPDGREIDINPEEVTSLRAGGDDGRGHFPPGAKCMINLTDGKFVAVIEECAIIRKQMEEQGEEK